MRRRLRFSLYILISQILLVALAISSLIQLIIIVVNEAVYFIERNPFILWSEITITLLITSFAIFIIVAQIQRLGERRRSDRQERNPNN